MRPAELCQYFDMQSVVNKTSQKGTAKCKIKKTTVHIFQNISFQSHVKLKLLMKSVIDLFYSSIGGNKLIGIEAVKGISDALKK